MNADPSSESADDWESDLQRFLDDLTDPGNARLSTATEQKIQDIAGQPTDPAATEHPHQIGPYLIIEQLGAGGMGTVYRARHVSLDREVALKILPEQSMTPTAVERFHREMQVLAQFSHPHIVSALDGNIVDGQLYLAMELVEGCHLKRLAESQSLSVADCCELIRQAALGVAALHARDIIHRDLKPTNIMVSDEGVVKVVDLGLAKGRLDPHQFTAPAALCCTVAFTSPEVLSHSRSADLRSDLFSLGRTLQFLLRTGPFSDPHQPTSVSIPDQLLALLQDLTTDDVDKRLGNAKELAQRLQTWASASNFYPRTTKSAGPVTATTAGTGFSSFALLSFLREWTLGFPPVSLRRRRATFISVLCVVLLAGVAGWQRYFARSSSPAPVMTGKNNLIEHAAADTRLSSDSGDVGIESTVQRDPPLTPPAAENRPTGGREEKLRRERKVADWLLQHGAIVGINFQMPSGRWSGIKLQPGAALPARDVVVQTVELPATECATADMIRELRQLSSLEGLHLLHPETPGEVLTQAGPDWNLKWVYLPSRQLDDRCVEALLQFRTSLLAVDLSHSRITDTAAATLATVTSLRSLELKDTAITDAALVHLRACSDLVHLDLSDTQVSQQGLQHLTDYPALQRLHVNGLDLNDECLTTLAAVDLEELHLVDTKISESAIQEFQKKNPNCAVVRWP